MHPIAFPIASVSFFLSLLISQAATSAAMTTKTIIPVVDLSDPAAAHNITKTFQAGPYTYKLVTLGLYPYHPDCSDQALPLLLQHSDTIFAQLQSRCDVSATSVPSPTSNPGNSSGSVASTDIPLRYGSWRCGQDRLYVDAVDESDGTQRCLRSWMECLRDDGVLSGGVVMRLPPVIAMVGLAGAACALLAM